MARRGYTTTIGKFAKAHHNRRVSEMRLFGEQLHREQETGREPSCPQTQSSRPAAEAALR